MPAVYAVRLLRDNPEFRSKFDCGETDVSKKIQSRLCKYKEKGAYRGPF